MLKGGQHQRSEQGKELRRVASEWDRWLSGQCARGTEAREFSEFNGINRHCSDTTDYSFLEVHPMSFLTQGLRPHPKTLASTQGEASKGHKAVC